LPPPWWPSPAHPGDQRLDQFSEPQHSRLAYHEALANRIRGVAAPHGVVGVHNALLMRQDMALLEEPREIGVVDRVEVLAVQLRRDLRCEARTEAIV
jgi:hypothetical protein